MSLLVLFRTRLEWCNFTCEYCPWNATRNTVLPGQFDEDRTRLFHVVDRVAELDRPVEFFITPKAEYLVLPYWREAVARLTHLDHVRRVTVQTNLSFDLEPFLESVDLGKLALWTTFHPTELTADDEAVLSRKWALLQEHGVPFSIGLVGTHENLPILDELRGHIPDEVYLWVNAYKREADYYSAEQLDAIRRVDPWFDLNNRRVPSRGIACTAGHRAVYLDDEGDLRRCFFVGDVIGNLFRDGWTTLDAPKACPVETCHCYVGHMHIVDLDFRRIYGDNLAVRIPNDWQQSVARRGRVAVNSDSTPTPGDHRCDS